MKFDEILVKELIEYWNEQNTRYSRFIVEVGKKSIKVKRYDGYGFPQTLQEVYNNNQLKQYIDFLKTY